MSRRTSSTDRSRLCSWNPVVDLVIVAELVGPWRLRLLAVGRRGFEPSDSPLTPAEEVGSEVLERPLPHRTRLGHAVAADLLDERSPRLVRVFDARDDLRSRIGHRQAGASFIVSHRSDGPPVGSQEGTRPGAGDRPRNAGDVPPDPLFQAPIVSRPAQ